jgi:acyl carrier protein phosphodiesterase
VNFLGHVHVALSSGRDDPGYLLGAALPDLAAMAGVRLVRAELDSSLADGVRCHLRADAAFHAHAGFRAGSGALRRDLLARAIGSGPARAIGHAGWELLLDGTLVGTGVETAFRRSLEAGERAGAAMSPAEAERWDAFLARVRRVGWLRYDDPRWVADRLHAMLDRRPRLRLPGAEVPTVAEVLDAHVEVVAARSAAVLGDTARAAA